MKDFVDEIDGVLEGTDINRKNLMAIQDYQDESVIFSSNSIVKINGDDEIETITFGQNQIIKEFVANNHTITQTITFTNNGYTKELS